MEGTMSVEQIIKSIIDKFGMGILKDGQKLIAVFSDYAPQQKKEQTLITYFVRSKGNTKILDVQQKTQKEQEICFMQIVHEMAETQFVDENAAKQICKDFFAAIGVNLSTEPFFEESIAINETEARRETLGPSKSYNLQKLDNPDKKQNGSTKVRRIIVVACALAVIALIGSNMRGINPALENNDSSRDANGGKSRDIVQLEEVSPWNSSSNGMTLKTSEITDNMGDTYSTALTSKWGWNEYFLERQYSTFEGKFVIEYDYRSSDKLSYIRIYGDDQLLFGAKITGGTKPINFKLDVSEVEILKIEINSQTKNGYEFTDLVEAWLCKEGFSHSTIPMNTPIYPKESTSLASLSYWNKSAYGIGPYSFESIEDCCGNEYFEFFSADFGYQEYALSGEYQTFAGRFICEHVQYKEEKGILEIYGDNALLYRVEISANQAPIDFSVDIAGIEMLKVLLDSPTINGGHEYTSLVNAYLL